MVGIDAVNFHQRYLKSSNTSSLAEIEKIIIKLKVMNAIDLETNGFLDDELIKFSTVILNSKPFFLMVLVF